MKLKIVDNYAILSAAAAEVVVDEVGRNPRTTMVWPTGATPGGAACELVARKMRSELNPARLRVVQLDEFVGLRKDDPRSLYKALETMLIDRVGVPKANVVRFDMSDQDLVRACANYDRRIAAGGGIDLCVLGLGRNGHIGFNEPPSARDARTRVVDLSAETIEAHASCFGGREHVPLQAVTAGMRLILSSRRIVLLVSGAGKREILWRVIDGTVSPEVPASCLVTLDNVTIIADRDAFGPQGGGS